jgi:TolB-like protein
MSADAEQSYLVDGLTEDLITGLSKAPGLFVIARNSSFADKGKSVVRHGGRRKPAKEQEVNMADFLGRIGSQRRPLRR